MNKQYIVEACNENYSNMREATELVLSDSKYRGLSAGDDLVQWYGDEIIKQGTFIGVGGNVGLSFGYDIQPKEELSLELGQVLDYDPALDMLAKLYDEASINLDSIKNTCNEEVTIAVGLLAAAGLCSVSPKSIRLTNKGREFVEFFIST